MPEEPGYEAKHPHYQVNFVVWSLDLVGRVYGWTSLALKTLGSARKFTQRDPRRESLACMTVNFVHSRYRRKCALRNSEVSAFGSKRALQSVPRPAAA